MKKRPTPPPPPPPRWRRFLPAGALVLAAVLAYANAMKGPFVFDDHSAILWNTQIRQLWPLSVPLSPPRETPVAGRPLVNLTLALNYAVGGYDVGVYHATNLAIHVLAALALFGVVRRAILLGPPEWPLRIQAEGISLACALLWILHPLQTEVVNYTTQRTTSLAGLLLLLTLYCSVRALTDTRRRWPTAAILSCAAGMACKESMVVAPVLIVLFDRVFVFRSAREALAARGRLYGGLAATWMALALMMAGEPRTTVGFDGDIGPWTYLLNQTQMIVDYLRLVVWPSGLVFDYGLPQTLRLADVLWPAAAVTGLALATLVSFRHHPRVGFLGAWFFITLSPSSSIVPIVTEVGAERRMYMPLAAIIVLVVCAAAHIARQRSAQRLATTVCLIVAALLATGTVLRNREYRSRMSLALSAVEHRPHGRNYFRAGTLLVESGRRKEGMEYLQRAKEADFTGSRFAIATELATEGHFSDALRELSEFMRRNPDHSVSLPAQEMLGQIYLAMGRLADAASVYEGILAELPLHDAAHEALGDIRLSQGRPADALPHLEHIGARRRGDVQVMGKLGTTLAATGRVDEAIAIFEAIVATNGRDVFARNLLGRTLALRGRLAEAVEHFERALELAPGNADVVANLERARRQLAQR